MIDGGKEAGRGQGQKGRRGERRGEKVTYSRKKEREREKGIYCKGDKCQRRGEGRDGKIERDGK